MTDPPYNVGKDYEATHDHLTDADYRHLLTGVEAACEIQAWVTPKKHLALFTSILPTALPVVVRRGAFGPLRWGWTDQFCLLLVRGRPSRPIPNLWDDIRLKGEGYFFRENDYGHPGYTPAFIMSRLVAVLAGPDAVVVDPFMGTGTTNRVAKDLGFKSIGIEINERYCEIAAKRMGQEVIELVR